MTVPGDTILGVSAPPPAGAAGKLERITQLAEHGLNTPRITLVEVGATFDSGLRQRLEDAARGDRLMTVRTYHPTDEITYAKGPFAPEVPVDEAIRLAEEFSREWNVLFQEAIDVKTTVLAGNIALSRDGTGYYEALAGQYRVRQVESPPADADGDLRYGSFAAPEEIGDPQVREAVERVLRSGLLENLTAVGDRVLLEFNVQEEPVGERREPLLFWEWRPLPGRGGMSSLPGVAAARADVVAYGVGVRGMPALDEPDGLEPIVGGKAAGLARAHAAGLPVPPYVVLGAELPNASELEDALAKLRSATAEFFPGEHARRLAVRSSPAVSMPGMLETVLHVDDDPAAVTHAVERVLASWGSERAVEYRRARRIPDDRRLGVVLQPMILVEESRRGASGVGLTRQPASGAVGPVVELVEGEVGLSLVSGDAMPLTTADVEQRWPDLFSLLSKWSRVLERAGRDMQEFEFAVEGDAAYLLQTRSAKRSAVAAVRVAYELATSGVIDAGRARDIVGESDAAHIMRRRLSTNGHSPAGTGRVASPGVAVGRAAFDREAVGRILRSGDAPILLVDVPSPDDYPLLRNAAAVVSSRGGITSHASVVALDAGIVAVVGCRDLAVHTATASAQLGEATIREGDWLSVEAHDEGAVYVGKLPEGEPSVPEELPSEAVSWARSLGGGR
jgi:phosphohistidine swiveling domain-containing protein